ncbi:hypothetical protein SAMN06265222_11695 [Neorhodopirellula lusitana]|uniref:Secreted protein n=1 Tax=Neorhodopirellula lusitana TaxID=445327 RepID=A0ABY1QJT1_9BACT|nr:hypothetical protein SAMN06265222_11695 [Neorhodopirellula lusitana]
MTSAKRLNSVMPFALLVLFALPSFGITASMCRGIVENEVQTQSEEVKERVACSSHRRAPARCDRGSSAKVFASKHDRRLPQRRDGHLRAIVGHRFTNDCLAPIRC